MTGRAARRVAAGFALLAAGPLQAHGFDERYDLPVPLAWVVVGACLVVALTFVAAALFMRPQAGLPSARIRRALTVPQGVLTATRTAALLLFGLTVSSALWGTADPLMNLAPTMVMIVWWLGLSMASALLGSVWALFDPWRTLFDAMKLQPATPHWRWPAWLGLWPAALLLLAWCWLEVVQPLASTPFRLGLAALAWTLLALAGMRLFGRVAWQSHGDVFAVVFGLLGRMAPLRLRMPGDEAAPPLPAAGLVALVMAMLATVIFDGLHGGAAWLVFEAALRRTVPRLLDTNGLFAGTAGLLMVWALFLLAYGATLRLTLRLLQAGAAGPALASALTITLLPIALAYNVAHNFSALLIQGQNVVSLLSDPFGLQWDILGTARWHPDIGLVDARTTWFVAVGALVLGHAASVWWAHRVVLAAGVAPRRAALGLLPMTLLMLAYTAISLLLIAEPMAVGG